MCCFLFTRAVDLLREEVAYTAISARRLSGNVPKNFSLFFYVSEVAKVLQKIGDDMSNNRNLNHLISEIQVTPNTAYKTFVSVAAQIFQDGTINWGRIVTLFYFAYKLALQCVNQLPLIDLIIGWVTKYVTETLAGWIAARGGWVRTFSCIIIFHINTLLLHALTSGCRVRAPSKNSNPAK